MHIDWAGCEVTLKEPEAETVFLQIDNNSASLLARVNVEASRSSSQTRHFPQAVYIFSHDGGEEKGLHNPSKVSILKE